MFSIGIATVFMEASGLLGVLQSLEIPSRVKLLQELYLLFLGEILPFQKSQPS